MKYVAYYRVSTSKQQRSGLGLDAQKATVASFLQPTDEVVADFVEVVSGKLDDRTTYTTPWDMIWPLGALLFKSATQGRRHSR
ncbi:recombinase family protein [Rhizobium ruizarguesonis]